MATKLGARAELCLPAGWRTLLGFIREVANEYDVEVVELDFLRFPSFFGREDPEANCRTMTAFVEEVRTVLDDAGLREKPRRHLLSAGFRFLEADLPFQIPMHLEKNETRGFNMLLAAAADGMKAEVRVTFEGLAHTQDLWLSLNDRPIGRALDIVAGPPVERKTKIAEFAIPGDLVRDGCNSLSVRCENTTVTILAVDVVFG